MKKDGVNTSQKRHNRIVTIIFCILFGIGIGAISTYFVLQNLNQKEKEIIDNNYDTKGNEQDKNNIDQSQTLSVDNDLVKELFYRMNQFTELGDIAADGFDYDFFYLKERTVDDINDSLMFAITYCALYEKTVESLTTDEDFNNFRFSLADINKKSLEIFGKDIDVDKIIEYNSINDPDLGYYPGYQANVDIRGKRFKYDRDKQEFSLTRYGLGGPDLVEYDTKIISAQKYRDKIEIVSKVMFELWIADVEENVAKLYRETTDNERTINNRIIKFDKEIADVSSQKYEDVKIDDYLDKLDSFKWTFTLNDNGNYIFNKVEKIV